MFIGGLNWDTTDGEDPEMLARSVFEPQTDPPLPPPADALQMYFEQFGEITHCTIMRDAESGRSRGFAFLTFKEPSSVNAVMAREHHLDGKNASSSLLSTGASCARWLIPTRFSHLQIDPKRAIPRSDTAKTDKLFVRALPPSCTQESFRAFWRQFGAITDATLMMDKETGRHRGFGFVNYERREDVDKVLQSGPHYMDGQMVRCSVAGCSA
jgi:RNA-binding protein Musashi